MAAKARTLIKGLDDKLDAVLAEVAGLRTVVELARRQCEETRVSFDAFVLAHGPPAPTARRKKARASTRAGKGKSGKKPVNVLLFFREQSKASEAFFSKYAKAVQGFEALVAGHKSAAKKTKGSAEWRGALAPGLWKLVKKNPDLEGGVRAEFARPPAAAIPAAAIPAADDAAYLAADAAAYLAADDAADDSDAAEDDAAYPAADSAEAFGAITEEDFDVDDLGFG